MNAFFPWFWSTLDSSYKGLVSTLSQQCHAHGASGEICAEVCQRSDLFSNDSQLTHDLLGDCLSLASPKSRP